MSNIKRFEPAQIRSVWLEDERQWFSSVIVVVGALTDSVKIRDDWYRIKQRQKISGIELSTICQHLTPHCPVGKDRENDCINAKVRKRIPKNKVKTGETP